MREYYNDDTDLKYDIVYDNYNNGKFDIDEIVAIHEEMLKSVDSPPSSTSLSAEKQTPSPTPYTSTTSWFPTFGTTLIPSSSPATATSKTSSSPTSKPSFVASSYEPSISLGNSKTDTPSQEKNFYQYVASSTNSPTNVPTYIETTVKPTTSSSTYVSSETSHEDSNQTEAHIVDAPTNAPTTNVPSGTVMLDETVQPITESPTDASTKFTTLSPSPNPSTSKPTVSWFPTISWTPTITALPTTSESSISSTLVNPQSTSGLRSCPEYLRTMDILSSTQSKDVVFTFSAEEVVTPKESYVRILETELLDYVAESVLSCKGQVSKSLRLSKSTNKDVIAISYSNHNKPFTKVDDCIITTSSLSHRSKHLCFIMKGAITIISDSTAGSDVENTALSAIETFLNEDFNQNRFIATKYLGPEISTQSPNDADGDILNLKRSHNTTGQIFVALVTVSLIGIFFLFIHRYYIRKKKGYRRANTASIEDASDASVSE